MRRDFPFRLLLIVAISLGPGVFRLCLAGVNYEEAPINYSRTKPDNAVSRLQARLDDSSAVLEFSEAQGYLLSVLKLLDVPVSSQVLTFAKTSMQAPHISPATPRAIYFNDVVHVGYVQGGLLEIAVSDPRLGMAFYTLDQQATAQPRFQHNANNCLTCHGAARTRNVPGLQVRSVFPDPRGQPVIAAGSLRTDHTSPFDKRWGGWYVTGRHGAQTHLGNFTLPDTRKPRSIDNAAGQNVTDLASRFETSSYPSPHSDLVALLVLEHQADAHNYLTLANFETRAALHQQQEQLTQPNASDQTIRAATDKQIAKAGDALVRYLLFHGEASLAGPVDGTAAFASEFAARGPRDASGRSLRDFDLTRRIFKFPCSYLVYSEAFAALPIEMRQYAYRRLQYLLTTNEDLADVAHLAAEERQAIFEILLGTKPDFADFVKSADPQRDP